MNLIYIVIVILIVIAIVSIIIRRVRHKDEKTTVDTRIITNIYGNAAVPDMEGNIEESLKNQNMLDEVMGAVQDLFFEICGEKAFCTEEQKDPDTGSFSLTYQIQDCPAPVVFECSHLGTFNLYFRYVDKAQTEKEHDSIFSKYDHKMDKDHIREALRLLLSVKH